MVALALALGAGAAASPPFAPDSDRVRALVAAGAQEIGRFATAPRRQRVVVLTSIGLALGCIPLAAFGVRRRRRERAREALVREQQGRAPQVFEAALTTRPLRLAPRQAASTERAEPEGLPPLGAPPPEVAAQAASLRAASVREAAERSLLLRAASERSETRRRAAALRARARREAGTEPAEAVPGAPIAAAAPAPGPAAEPARADAGSEAPRPRGSAVLAALEQAEPRQARAQVRELPAPAQPTGGRVAILHSSGPLTFEWLEQTLARDPEDFQARLDLCTALLVAERFADAERVAREGLARDESDGRLLLRLSEALAGQDRTDEALEAAVRAVRSHRSRKAILHLTRISALAHRFVPGDGPRLRKALQGRPHDPVFLHALGVCESLHGSTREALDLLRLALQQERSPRWRRVVSREIARLRARELAAPGSGRTEPRRAAG